MIILQRRLASSVAAIKKSLINRVGRLEDLRRMSLLTSSEIGDRDIENFRSEWEGFDELDEKEKEELERKIEALTLAHNMSELETEISELKNLLELADTIKTDAKAEYLMEFITSLLEKDPSEKILVFTEFTDTLDFLEDLVEKRLGIKVARIDGSMSIDRRAQQEEIFSSQGINVMIATDAAGEGLNLQFARILVNYELPWNPNRLEQRIGRLHRIGQNRKVLVYNIAVENTIEGRVFQILVDKINVIKQSLGERIFDVLGLLLADVNIEELVMQTTSIDASFSNRMSSIQSVIDAKVRIIFDELERNSLILDQLDIEPIRALIRVGREQTVTGSDVERFVRRFLSLKGGKLDETDSPKIYLPTLPPTILQNKSVRHRMMRWRFLPGAEEMAPKHLISKDLTFYKEIATRSPTSIEFVSLGHPLLNAIIQSCTDTSFGGRVSLKFDRLGRSGLLFVFLEKLIENRIIESGQRVRRESITMVFYDVNKDSLSILDPKAIWEFDDVTKPPAVPSVITEKMNPAASKAETIAREEFGRFVGETQERTDREITIKINDAKKWLEAQSVEILKRIAYYKRRGDRDSNITIRGENSRLAELSREYEKHVRSLKEELVFVRDGPYLEALAVVLPRPSERRTDYETKRVVELAGMSAALSFETDSGREPHDVSAEFRGYDITSKGQVESRFIEVKSFQSTGSLEITSNEWIMAEKLGQDYWIYVVENTLNDEKRTIFFIRDPAKTLKDVADLKELYEFRVVVKQWKEAAIPQGKAMAGR